MTTPSREAIYQALFALVTPLLAPGAVSGPPDGNPGPDGVAATPGTPTAQQPFQLISREVIEVQRVPPLLQPVLMQYEFNEENRKDGKGLIKKIWTVVFIFGATSTRGTPGASILNPLIDQVEAAMQPGPGDEYQTLGGLVESVLLVGTGGKDHGDNSTKADSQQAAYYLPVEITLPTT